MTLKELIMKIDFDSLLPYLEKWEKKNLDNIYAFREAYDILRNMEPDKDYRGEVTIITTTREDGTKITQVNFLDDNVWEKELAKEFVFPNGMQLNMEELAMRCLWEITFYGFSPVDREDTFSKMFGRRKPLNRYEVALDKLEESMWKHQTPRKFRARDEDGARLTIAHLPFKFCNKPMNRSKKKRKYRQDKREEYLEVMAKRETLIQMLTIPGSSFKRSDVEFLFDIAYGIRYDYCSVVLGTNGRLDYILESMTKYQQLDLSRYDHAIVFIRYSSCYPPDNTELETFRQAVHNRLGYENILFGTVVENNECEQIKVMLLLNKAI